jgi:hypothetical protein
MNFAAISAIARVMVTSLGIPRQGPLLQTSGAEWRKPGFDRNQSTISGEFLHNKFSGSAKVNQSPVRLQLQRLWL